CDSYATIALVVVTHGFILGSVIGTKVTRGQPLFSNLHPTRILSGREIIANDVAFASYSSLEYLPKVILSFSHWESAGIYKDTLAGAAIDASRLNDLVVNRNNGTSTDKGFGNVALSTAPVVGKILAAPPQILTTNANGDSAPPTLAYLGYAWSGGSATLDGQAVTGNAGVSSAGTGTHTLSGWRHEFHSQHFSSIYSGCRVHSQR
ncbi:MAG: hypothetical protein Q8L87_17040, partial [Anaerolineales bacterium]|nr:hypothetical protein [Anaerolineales bacterium]